MQSSHCQSGIWRLLHQKLDGFNGCTRLFSKSKGIEVAFLHSKQCLEKVSSCSDLYKGYEEPTFDGEYWHLPLNDYFLNGNIKWKELDGDYPI